MSEFTQRPSTKRFLRTIPLLVAIILMAYGWYYVVLSDPRTITATIEDVRTIRDTSSNGQGQTHTDTYYLVVTDKGVFQIRIDGILANADGLTRLRQGNVAEIDLRGRGCEFLGAYPFIVGVRVE